MPTKKSGSKKRSYTRRKPTSKKSATKKKANTKLSSISNEFIGVILIGLAIFLGFVFYSKGMGMVGEILRGLIMGLVGVFAYALPVLLFIVGILLIADIETKEVKNPKSAYTIGIISLLSLIHTISFKSLDLNVNFITFVKNSYNAASIDSFGGGVFGALLSYPVNHYMGKTACYLIFIMALLVCLMIITNFSVKAMTLNLAVAGKSINKNLKEKMADRPKRAKNSREELFVFDGDDAKVSSNGEMDGLGRNNRYGIKDDGKNPIVMPNKINEDEFFENGTKRDDIKIVDSINSSDDAIDIEIEDYNKEEQEPEPYVKPPYALLKNAPSKRGRTGGEAMLRAQAQTLEDTLKSFNLDAKVVNICRGPVVTRFEVAPAPGVRVSRIVSLSDDIALNLAAQSIRIEAPIPGRAAIGIEVPNNEVAMVYLKELIDTAEYRNTDSYISFALGKDIAGKKIYADISKMPHLLVAGATGSGKSVCINGIIMSVLYNATPEDVRMILIDPKVVELSVFNDIPHLLVPVVTDPRKAASAVNWAVVEMQRRYKVFAASGMRDIDGYNEKAFKDGSDKIPQILVVIDELADLMMFSAREIEDAICRIAQLGRACGIHLVIATQRPSVDVITGTIKANIPSRIAFAVSSHTDSRTILDMGGAEKLLGKGDMLYYPTGRDQPIRVQGCFITHSEVNAVAGFLKSDRSNRYDEEVIDNIKKGNTGSNKGSSNKKDEYLKRAIEIVLEYEQASISMLQRRLRVGYARAARLIDEMELMNIVSKSEGPKPRQVLISWEQFREMFKEEE
jgi:DNA segregation ATPase FtsK/SpoIIIE, S-DNA-T family